MKELSKKLLSLGLVVCLLTSSVTPALAQLRPVVRGGQAALQGGKTVSKVSAAGKKAVTPYVAGQVPFRTQPIRLDFSPAHIQGVITQQVARQQILPPNIARIQALARAEKWEGLASAISNLPADALHKPALLRNEFVSAALAGKASKEQITEAVEFYRADLMQRAALLADIPEQSAASFLEQTPPETLKVYQEIFSSAGALALLGNKDDAAILLDFWQHAKDGPLAEVATNITGRGLLRFKAYEEFNEWAKIAQPRGEVWVGFDAYLARHNELPIQFTVIDPHVSSLPREQLGAWLSEGCVVNMVNAFLSPQVTVWWVEDLGKDPDVLSYLLTHSPQGPVQPAQNPAPSTRPALTAQIPQLPPLQADLSVSLSQPESLPFQNPGLTSARSAQGLSRVAAQTVQTPMAATSRSAVDNSGMLYSGLPLFAWAKSLANVGKYVRSWNIFNRRTRSNAAFNEDPVLHENTVKNVFEDPEEVITEPDDLVDYNENDGPILVGESGFKLTIENINGEEQILSNVDVGINAPIKTNGYNRLVLSNGHIFQLRNLTQNPSNLEHFYFELPHQQGELWQLLSTHPANLGLNRPLRIKLEHMPNRRYKVVSMRVAVEDVPQAVPVVADMDAALLPEQKKGSLLIKKDGTVEFLPQGGSPVLLNDFYVRLPKEESRYWAPLMQAQPQSKFSLQIHSTAKKTNVLTVNVPMEQIGLSKTVSPEVESRTTLGEATSSALMLGINNVLPALMGFVHPLLRRYGEAAVLRVGANFFVAGGVVALASGLYGFLGDGLMSPWKVTGFLISSVFISLGSTITRLVQNPLIIANRGKIVPKDSFSVKPENETNEPAPVYNLQHLKNRFGQVFTQRPTTSARNVVLFQTGQMFKNIGTMTFLATPWLINATAKGLFGIELGLDFSASYVPYTVFAAWTSYKLARTTLKDAVPSNLTAVENNFQEALADVIADLKNQPGRNLRPEQDKILTAAKKLKGAMEILSRVESRHQKISFEKLMIQHEKECVAKLRDQLLAAGRSTTTANTAARALQDAFDSLGHRNVQTLKVLGLPKIFPSIMGMTLATMHELSVSNGFAFTMHNLLPNGAYANALTALVLYGSMSTGRLLGNWISRRISGGSMYALSSAFSVVGTATMVAANGNVPLLMTGAVIASFGVGNFFSQMYEYMTGLYPKFRREISLLINYTMPTAAILSMPMRKLVGMSGFAGMDLLVAGVGLLGSLALTRGMFANSSIVRASKYGLGQLKQYVKNVFHKGKTPPSGLDNAATAQ